jgi:hypothetical protein
VVSSAHGIPSMARVITRVRSQANATTTAVCNAPITAIAAKNARDADA